MDKEHIKGAADKAKGAVKDAAGKLMDDKKLQAEGKMTRPSAKRARPWATPRTRPGAAPTGRSVWTTKRRRSGRSFGAAQEIPAQRSSTTSARGRLQQIRRSPFAGGVSGSGRNNRLRRR